MIKIKNRYCVKNIKLYLKKIFISGNVINLTQNVHIFPFIVYLQLSLFHICSVNLGQFEFTGIHITIRQFNYKRFRYMEW